MKMIYLANARIPTEKAHGYQIMKMCEAFARANLDVELVVPWRLNRIRKDPFKYYQVSPDFTIKKLFSLDLIGIIPRIGLWIQMASFAIISFFYVLSKRPVIVYSRDEAALFLVSFFRNNLVWEAHSGQDSFIAKKVAYKCKRLFVLTRELQKYYEKLGVPADKITVAPDAVDLEVFDIRIEKNEARAHFALPENKIIIGYTGSFRTKGMDKGIGDAVSAVTILNRKDILFVAIGGNKTDIFYYQKFADRLGVGKRVKFLPRVSQKELAIFQKACDMLLMPFPKIEHYAYFMSPMKMFEYMAADRPIIATDLPSVRDVLNAANAVLVKPGEAKKLAEAISEIVHNKKLAEQISSQAYKDVQEYTWDNRVRMILSALNLIGR